MNGIDYITELRAAVWSKSHKNSNIDISRYYCERIVADFKNQTGQNIGWETIRDFLTGERKTVKKTLSRLSAYVLNDTNGTFLDFQSFCDQSLTDATPTETPIKDEPKRSYAKVIGIAIILLLLLTAAGRFVLKASYPYWETKEWTYNFTDPQLTTLKKDQWSFSKDSINLDLWSAQNHPDSAQHLTLRTLLGDSYLESRDYTPYIINGINHKIQLGDCAEIEVKIKGFNPYSRYQQAGFSLYAYNSQIPSLRYTFAATGNNNHVEALLRTGEYHSEHLMPVGRYRKRVVVSKISAPDTPDATPEIIVRSITLKIRIENGSYFFSYSIDEKDFLPIRSLFLALPKPKYLSLIAFQGRPDLPHPVWPVADVIDAQFEYVRVMSCE